jgi:hypothetical protein
MVSPSGIGLPTDCLEKTSTHARRFLDVLTLPPIIIEKGTPYERDEAPFCHEDNKKKSLMVIFKCEARNSSWMGDEDNYYRSEYYEIPNELVSELLTGICPGSKEYATGGVKIFKEDHAYGHDCEEPHDYASHRLLNVTIFAELSEDQKTAALTIMRFAGGANEEHVRLSRTDS